MQFIEQVVLRVSSEFLPRRIMQRNVFGAAPVEEDNDE